MISYTEGSNNEIGQPFYPASFVLTPNKELNAKLINKKRDEVATLTAGI